MRNIAIIGFVVMMGITNLYGNVPQLSHNKLKVENKIPHKCYAFDLRDVRLLDGPFKHAMELDRQYLLSLDVDRLLHNFRVNAGEPSSAHPFGGWEEPKCELRGHFVGHYLSACAMMFASTGDEQLKGKGNAVVAGLAECQAKIGNGYLSAYPEEFFDRVEKQQRVWAPYYTLHKIYAGLLDMYVYCDNQQALEVCRKFADWVIARNARLTDDQMQKMLGNEHGGMNEVLANLYGLTGEEKYLKIAQRFNHQAVLEPLSRREDKLTGLHANTQFPKVIGAARQYELTADTTLNTIAIYFWNVVTKERSYIIGGNSDGEMFSPKERLSQALGPNTTETCNTYNMLKLTRHLFCWDPQPEYADYYERALYNHILASQNPRTGMMCYYVPLRSGSQKNYCDQDNSFWCCTGTGVENHAKYGDSIYFHDGQSNLYLNLFIASEINWKDKGIKIRQETKYPQEDSTHIVVTCEKPVELNLNIRHPYWAVGGIQVTINGNPLGDALRQKESSASKPGSYLTLSRVWKSGDTVDVAMPMTLRIEAFRDNPRRFAFMHGPLVLCAEVDTRKQLPVIVAEENQILSSLKPVAGKPSTFTGSPQVFRIPGEKEGDTVTLEPFYTMHGKRNYIVYWDALTPTQWQAKEEEYKAEQARQKELEAKTVDVVNPGEEQNERDHKLKGDNTAAGEFGGRKWRHATDGGWFSWEIKVLADRQQELLVTYWGSDGGNRVFDILIDDTKLRTQRLQNNKPGKFYDEVYNIPEDLTKGKQMVTVKFQAKSGAWAGGVFGLRVLKAGASEPKAKAETKDQDSIRKDDYPLKAVPFKDVEVTDEFWSARLETNRKATIPHTFKEAERTGRINNFAKAAKMMEGKFEGIYFNDSDVYKIIEGASYSLAVHPDGELDKYLDELIVKIAAAQEPDGYLYTARTLCGPDYMPPGGKERWSDIAGGHELYCLGHLFEAAVAHYQATGKVSLLNVATRSADLVCSVFNESGKRNPPGHQEIEIGLVKLYRVTGDEKYLRQAKFFLEQRGRPEGHHLYGTYSQDHKPVAEQDEAVGHAVRACYMYSGMADVAALCGENSYLASLNKIWTDVVGCKLYLTGGIGAAGGHEGFGPAYDLPNLIAYCETCAAIANAFWNHRMFLLTGDARYMDVFERVLYNGLISGVSLDGTKFFYPNPLESDGRHRRSPWFDCACCPSNIPRFIPQVPGYVYAHRGDELFVNLFIAGRAKVRMNDQIVSVKQETRYPWDGRIKLTIEPEKQGQEFTLLVRIPGWTREEVVPSDLYRFFELSKETTAININGTAVKYELQKGYAAIRRNWQKGDVIEMVLAMPVRRIVSNEKIADNVGKVALQRGPIVYCVEWPDVKDGHVVNLLVPDDAAISTKFEPDLLGGVQVLRFAALGLARAQKPQSVKSEKVECTAIPYYAWAYRGPGEMAVWLARIESAARPLPATTIASKSRASASGGDVKALNDQREPKSSGDHSNRFLHWWPRKGTKEWVQYDFQKPAKVSAVEIYWFDDTGRGECRLPKSWQLLYRESDQWKPVQNPSGCGCEGDRYNRTTFEPVITDGLRIDVQLPQDFSAGIHEWRVEEIGQD
jgi:DUF1680 family protein